MKSKSALVLLAFLAVHGEAFASLVTTGTLSRWFGDVGDPAIWEVFVDDVQVPKNLPDLNGFPQGELFLPPGTQSVEFKNRGVGLPGFNTPTLIAFSGTDQANPLSTLDEFLLGTLALTNGIFFFQAGVDIQVSSASDDPAFDGKFFNDTLQYIVTPNNGISHEDDADYAFFVGRPDLGKVRVYEAASGLGNTGSIELWGRVGSLIPTAFRNATGGVFLDSSTAVPEPGVGPLLAFGLLGLAAGRPRRR
jgi:uncharacterized protein (TIGR03382 family)